MCRCKIPSTWIGPFVIMLGVLMQFHLFYSFVESPKSRCVEQQLATHELMPLNTEVAILIPFILAEVKRIEVCFRNQWKVNYQNPDMNLQPCSSNKGSEYAKHIDLVFYFNRNHEAPEVSRRLNQMLNVVREEMGSCFRSVKIISAYLSDAEDTHPYGTSRQVYRALMLPNILGREYDYMQILETDMYVVREYWVDRIYENAAAAKNVNPVWIAGSAFHGKAFDGMISKPGWYKKVMLSWGPHINGAAMYALNDEEFSKFVARTAYNPDLQEYAYDVAFILQMQVDLCLDLAYIAPELGDLVPHDYTSDELIACLRKSSMRSKFVFTDFSQNIGNAIVEWKDVELKPSTYFLHGNARSASMYSREVQNLKDIYIDMGCEATADVYSCFISDSSSKLMLVVPPNSGRSHVEDIMRTQLQIQFLSLFEAIDGDINMSGKSKFPWNPTRMVTLGDMIPAMLRWAQMPDKQTFIATSDMDKEDLNRISATVMPYAVIGIMRDPIEVLWEKISLFQTDGQKNAAVDSSLEAYFMSPDYQPSSLLHTYSFSPFATELSALHLELAKEFISKYVSLIPYQEVPTRLPTVVKSFLQQNITMDTFPKNSVKFTKEELVIAKENMALDIELYDFMMKLYADRSRRR